MVNDNKITCEICGYCSKINPFSKHLSKVHNMTSRQYYDLYLKEINEDVCNECGKKTTFRCMSKGYLKFCSSKCSNKNKDKIEKQKVTCKNTLGVDFPAQAKSVQEKIKKTCLKKYGHISPLHSNEIQRKIKNTNLEKYGVDNHLSSKEIREKIKTTCFKKYNASSPLGNINIQNEIKENRKINTWDVFNLKLQQKNIKLLGSKSDYLINEYSYFKCLLCENILYYANTNAGNITCECRKSVSNKELEVSSWLNSLNLNIIQSDRKILYGLELDIYLPDYNLAIEFDGLYWHSEVYKDKNYHLNKTNLCKEKNIQLIHIFENEWDNKQNIVKSIILNKVHIYNKKIQARKCHIKEISNQEYREFVEVNHIQGYTQAKHRIGLYFEDELVQVCGFGKNRFKKDEIELIRSCSKLNTQVIGGFNKLIKYFVKTYDLKNLVSYVDLRYFNGNGYKDWELINQSTPNYWYWKMNTELILESRIKYQKYKLKNVLEKFNADMTEWENMQNNGYTRIWDCGNLKYKYIGE